MFRRPFLIAAASALSAPSLAFAQGRPVRVVVPFAPGGQSDTVMRLLQPKMAEHLGVPVVVENRPGGGGAVGAGVVAAAPPDGTTLFFDSFGFVVQPLIQRGLPFDYATAFAPVAQVVAAPYVLVVTQGFPATDVAGFLAEARRRNGVPYGTPGIGTVGHLAGALLAHRAGVVLEHLPYRGGAESARDVAAGNLASAIGTANSFKPVIDAGRARGIALTSADQRGSLAHLPTIAASGFPGFDLTSWNGIFAPAATPRDVVLRLEAAAAAATSDPATRDRLAATGNDAITAGAEAFGAVIRRDGEMVRRLVAETGISLAG
ncbi:twin-arginine translocation pathway signal protein [Roseomonas sp. PWR1]|uniref:Twin-arginine translocation pathway signal protein n=1 Tax=Roseomonas nitratireducens TaxID=2820810 RepID=A0ABS4AVF1_9PROT|nr:tripartite tricarboxylate transporter substrate-binding protein [Neoroseomonas nitratireducens]MBP0465292.1 twin-arginine translocation pathway signal protein [Neoroseomonas nitratireducens]